MDPRGAKIEPDRVFSESCGQFSGLYYDKGPRRSISNSTHRRRFTEHALELGSETYVIGMARFNDDLGVPEVRHDDEAELFLISTRDEKQIARRYGFGAFFKLAIGMAFAFMIPVGRALGETNTFEEAFVQRPKYSSKYSLFIYWSSFKSGPFFLICKILKLELFASKISKMGCKISML